MMQNKKVKIIGLTGGTGSGKSTVAAMAKKYGAAVIDADIIARKIVEPGQEALREIVKFFGQDILLESGQLNRRKLGDIVFNDKEKLKELNRITHPHIINEIKKEIEIIKNNGEYNSIIIDAAVLIDSGLSLLCDEIWVVTADKEIRLKRIMERDRLEENSAISRINSQMSDAELITYADVIINNNGNLTEIEKFIQQLLENNFTE